MGHESAADAGTNDAGQYSPVPARLFWCALDLGTVIEREASHAEARILRAIIHIVQARYAKARRDCQIVRAQSPLIGTGCYAVVDGSAGKAGVAYEKLSAVLSRHPQASSSEKQWVQILAERSLNLISAAEHESALAARFHAAQMRGESVHQQEESRCTLHVEKNPQKALALAQ